MGGAQFAALPSQSTGNASISTTPIASRRVNGKPEITVRWSREKWAATQQKAPAPFSIRQAPCFSAGIGDGLIIVFVLVETQITYNWLPKFQLGYFWMRSSAARCFETAFHCEGITATRKFRSATERFADSPKHYLRNNSTQRALCFDY